MTDRDTADWQPNSRLWRSAVEPRSGFVDSIVRSVQDARARARPIASAIADDLPEFTVHDTSHTDALWPLIDLIAGDNFDLTPTEAWTLAVAVILHDLGLAVAAYPDGIQEIRENPAWPDARAAALRAAVGRQPTAEELRSENEAADVAADSAILRQSHAERANALAFLTIGGEPFIANQLLRESLGATAGQIAASHWWPVDRLAELQELEGAPAGMPPEWTVRPILLACLLRVADAAHLDALRAPSAELVRRRLGKVSSLHWEFQNRLRQPVAAGDQIKFVSSRSFPPDLAEAWWTCVDHLRLLDDELVGTAAVLQSVGEDTFAIRSVAGARDLRALGSLVRVEGWRPVDASIGVTDVAKMVSRLGGKALYGDTPFVPLRELLQNASDAVRARERLRPDHKGRVLVNVSGDRKRLTVIDDGVGMAESTLVGALLDFGNSLWESPGALAAALPGLQATGFIPTGHFGIGFFSVFMWADEVTVVSRPFNAGETETLVLTFGEGLSGRPIVRDAEPDERLSSPGTSVTLSMREPLPALPHYTEPPTFSDPNDELVELLRWLAPCFPVDLDSSVEGAEARRAVDANDWITIPGSELVSRFGERPPFSSAVLDRSVRCFGDASYPTGRATLTGDGVFFANGQPGITVAGGLRVGTTAEFCGVVRIEETNASRSSGAPSIDPNEITAWASEQAELRLNDRTLQQRLASNILALGGTIGALRWAVTRNGFLNSVDVEQWAKNRREVIVLDVENSLDEAREYMHIPLDTSYDLPADAIDQSRSGGRWSYKFGAGILEGADSRSLRDELKCALARAWNCDVDQITEEEGEIDLELEDGDISIDARFLLRPTMTPLFIE